MEHSEYSGHDFLWTIFEIIASLELRLPIGAKKEIIAPGYYSRKYWKFEHIYRSAIEWQVIFQMMLCIWQWTDEGKLFNL